MDNVLKPLATNSRFHFDELIVYATFKEKWDACINKLVEERASEKAAALVQEGGDALADVEPDPLKSSNPTHFKENSATYWTAYASQFVKQYVRLVPEPETRHGVADLVSNSELKNLRGIEGRSSVIVFYDVDCASESQNRPGDRKPPHLEENYKKVIQGAMQGRGGQRNTEGVCVSGSHFLSRLAAVLVSAAGAFLRSLNLFNV